MKNTLKVVAGAIQKNNPVNIFKAVHLYGDRIQAQDGRITVDATCPMPGDYTVEAARFTQAVNACDGAPVITFTDGGRLSVKKGGFKAVLPLFEHTDYPRVAREPTAEMIKLPADIAMLPLFARLLPLCAEDGDSRVWTTGLNLAFGYAWATDGTIMARSPLPFALDTSINIPAAAIAVLIKMGSEPKALHITESAITFDLGDAWMRAQLLNVPWPDVRSRMANNVYGDTVPEGVLDAVERILPFCIDGLQMIRFSADGISTASGEHQAQVDGIALPAGRYSGRVLRKALTLATHANFAAFPDAVGFKGDGIEGMFTGLRV